MSARNPNLATGRGSSRALEARPVLAMTLRPWDEVPRAHRRVSARPLNFRKVVNPPWCSYLYSTSCLHRRLHPWLGPLLWVREGLVNPPVVLVSLVALEAMGGNYRQCNVHLLAKNMNSGWIFV
ncbi:hypothetical protein CDL15_Pgr028701 [Punica granatum]|uniref:Uncharacterized protein n=1 Tax=Punica granatum TaxID=22663 RepID=A0A218VXD4_PUNGR|nr:hypothetical protein CDL15_Pgr028701 [Punica granatum]PKI56942.1 hypothetical protein CRG98_022677 [Punica granatum]